MKRQHPFDAKTNCQCDRCKAVRRLIAKYKLVSGYGKHITTK